MGREVGPHGRRRRDLDPLTDRPSRQPRARVRAHRPRRPDPLLARVDRRVHEHDCAYIVQLAFAGRHREIVGIHYDKGISSTDKAELFRAFPCTRMTAEQIASVVRAYGQAARRAREAGADGVEIHGANGFVITQFLSREINDRTDEYGGSLETEPGSRSKLSVRSDARSATTFMSSSSSASPSMSARCTRGVATTATPWTSRAGLRSGSSRRRRRFSRLLGGDVSAPPQPGRQVSGRRRRPDLRRRVEWQAPATRLRPFQDASQAALEVVVGAAVPRPRRRDPPRRRRGAEACGRRPGHLRRRLPDCFGDPRRNRRPGGATR